MKTTFFCLGLVLAVLSPCGANGQVKSADSILKDIQVEGRVSFAEASLPFKLNSTELASPNAEAQVKEIAKALSSGSLAGKTFQITGHTCDLGTDAHNLDLSKRRAQAISGKLQKLGVGADRIQTDGKGESMPAVPNDSEGNRRQNRRVVIALASR